MYKILKFLNIELNKIHECTNDELPLDYNFKENKVGMYYIVNSGSCRGYKNVYSLDIHFFCLKENKIELLKLLDKVEEKIGNKKIEDFYITHQNVFTLNPKSEDKTIEHFILSYYINIYK